MRIVQAIGWYFPGSLGGTETYVAALSRRLVSLGHEVTVAAPEPGGSTREYQHDGVPVFRYPIPLDPTRGECQGDAPVRGAEELHRFLERHRPDVFHCHSLVTGLGIREVEAARAAGARVLVTFHTPGLGYLCQRGTMMRWGETICDGLARPAKCAACDLQHRGLSRPIASIVGALPLALSRTASAVPGLGIGALIERNVLREKQLFAHAQAVFVLTEWARRAVEANLGRTDKLHLNRLGVATGFDRPVERSMSSPPRLGFLGRPDPIKGIWVLAEAVSKLEPELDFTLEVRGSFGSDAVRKFRERSLDDRRVRFEPAVSPDEVPAVLARYDVLICPSLALEGGPTVALEAHAMGTPVIGSRIGGLAEIVEDDVNGLLVDPGDAKALASALRRVVAEPDTVLAWRNRISKPRTMDEIVRDYLPHYERTHSGFP